MEKNFNLNKILLIPIGYFFVYCLVKLAHLLCFIFYFGNLLMVYSLFQNSLEIFLLVFHNHFVFDKGN